MQDRYTLILVSLNPDSTDLSGNLYPVSGHIAAKSFQPDTDIRYGLYGTQGGKAPDLRWVNKDTEATFRVVKTESSNEIVSLDSVNNFVKFRHGMVVASGSIDTCCVYICQNCSSKGSSDCKACNLIGLRLGYLPAEVLSPAGQV